MEFQKGLLSNRLFFPLLIQTKVQVVVGSSHRLFLTHEGDVYAWGQNDHGQLGLGDRVDRKVPTVVESLRGRDVHTIAAGNGFTLIGCDRGAVLACGKRLFAGLGRGSDDALRPALVDSLLR